MKYALLIFPKPGSHEALGPDEYGPSTLNTWRCARTRAASEAPICNQPRRRPRFVIALARP